MSTIQMMIWQKEGCIILYPILKPIIEYIAQNGAPINITLTEPDLNLIKA